MRRFHETLFLLALCFTAISTLKAQEADQITMTVTYVTSRQVYLDAGTEQGVTVGDTVMLSHSGLSPAQVVITAVASHSAVGRSINPQLNIKTGDKGSIWKGPRKNHGVVHPPEPVISGNAIPSSSPGEAESQAEPENILCGWVGLQFSGEWADDSRLNVAQPAAAANLRLRNIQGTGMALSFSGREYYEMTDAYARYGDSVRSRFDIYQFQVERDRPGDWFGFSAGRMVSRYASGLGTFDGGQFFLRQGAFTSGVMIGKGIEGRALGTGGNDTKTAVFAGFHAGEQSLWTYDATVAYARQMVNGQLDRSFVYLQGAASLGPELSMFGNAEVDLNEMDNGQRVSATRLSSAMLYFNYSPVRWLSASLGYDGTRSVYLFETMKSIPDSLINESIRHGFRARATFRPLPGLSLTGMASFGTRKGDPRNTRTLSGGVRFMDLFGSGINAGARYASITNTYLGGTDVTYELERLFLSSIELLLRYDDYSYSIANLGHAYNTQTFSADLSWYISRSWYSSARADYIIDDTVNGLRVFLELGIRF